MTAAFPDLRSTRGLRPDPIALAVTVGHAEATLKPIKARTWNGDAALRRTLHGAFPDWAAECRERLAHAILAGGHHEVREALYSGVGIAFGLKGSSIPELVTQGRRLIKLERRKQALRDQIAARGKS
jgi:hypothetical protein